MKKFTLFLALFAIVGFSYGQKFKTNPNIVPVDRTIYAHPTFHDADYKGEGDVFYYETFDFADPDDPRGWSLPDGWQVFDENDLGHYWVWRAGTDSVKGRYTFEPGHRFSLTPDDGYFVLPMDEYNFVDGANLGLGGHAWFQMAPVDCSDKTSVILRLRQYWRACCGAPNVKLRISVDQGIRWADIDLRYGTPTNSFCQKPVVEVNISDLVAGWSEVWFRFEWNDNSHYFWVLDDFELSEGYTNEIQLEDVWPMMSDLYDDDNDQGFVFLTPFSQINDLLGGWTFSGAFLNAGSEDAFSAHLNAQVWKNGEAVYNENSEEMDLWALDRDTFDVTVPYFPDDYGSYRFKLTAEMQQTDGAPANNVYEDWFHVTDVIYSVSDWDFETYSSTASWGNNDGDFLGIVYDITEEVEVDAMSVLIQQRPENPVASTQPGYSFQYFIFYYEEAEAIWVEKIAAEWTVVEEDMINTWVTLPMEKDGESEFLAPGQYIAAIQVFHGGGMGPDNNVYRFTIGSDLDHKYSNGKTVYQLNGGDGWYINSTDLSMIQMHLNKSGAPQEGSVVFNVDMNIPITNGYFHPEWGDFVDVAGSFNDWNGSAQMTDEDGDGIYTLTVSGIPVFEDIEYKYRINADWDTSEFPMGGPNRVYKTHYFSVTNDEYNNGIALSVPSIDIASSLNVYPNPGNGLFTLDIRNEMAVDLNVAVTNIQGQVVYHKLLTNVMSHSETIDLTGFAKGMYFLKVNDTVTKLLVQ